jgi:hypothetical protein
MKRYALLFLALWLLVLSCLAQDKQQSSTGLDGSSLRWFEDDANRRQDTLLFKSLEYTAPYAGLYFELRLDKDGNAFTARIVPNWAVQNSRHGKLTAEQIEEVKRMLAAPYFQSPTSPGAPERGERYTAFVFFKGGDYARSDYSGPLPVEVREVVDFVKAEIERQEKLRHEKWLEEQKQKTQSEPPPKLERED